MITEIEEIEDSDFDLTKLPTETEADREREEAFGSSFSWKGVVFEGVSSSKKDLWVSLCHKAGFPAFSACCDDLRLFVPLAKALVWVCITPRDDLRRLQGLGMKRVMDEFLDWSDDNVLIHDEHAITALGERILVASTKNQAEAVPSGKSSGK